MSGRADTCRPYLSHRQEEGRLHWKTPQHSSIRSQRSSCPAPGPDLSPPFVCREQGAHWLIGCWLEGGSGVARSLHCPPTSAEQNTPCEKQERRCTMTMNEISKYTMNRGLQPITAGTLLTEGRMLKNTCKEQSQGCLLISWFNPLRDSNRFLHVIEQAEQYRRSQD